MHIYTLNKEMNLVIIFSVSSSGVRVEMSSYLKQQQ